MSGFGDAAAVTPELNHAMMAAGDLGESLVQAAAGYESVADMLIAELTAMSLNTSTTAMVAWQGPGGAIYEMTAEQFCAVCGEASAWVRVGQIQAAEVAAAHTAALEMMIPAPACLANRASQAGLVASNVFGQNTPGIIGLDAQYGGFLGDQRDGAHRVWAGGVHGAGGVVGAAAAVTDCPGSGGPGCGCGRGCRAKRRPGCVAGQRSNHEPDGRRFHARRCRRAARLGVRWDRWAASSVACSGRPARRSGSCPRWGRGCRRCWARRRRCCPGCWAR